MLSRDSLLSAAQGLSTAFSNGLPVSQIITHFSSTFLNPPEALEHGLPQLAPFLGRSFTGVDGISEYFSLLQNYLTFSDMKFSEWMVDVDAKKVCVKGEAEFKWKRTGCKWNEVFVYVLDMVEEAGEMKVARYQVWADSGAGR